MRERIANPADVSLGRGLSPAGYPGGLTRHAQPEAPGRPSGMRSKLLVNLEAYCCAGQAVRRVRRAAHTSAHDPLRKNIIRGFRVLVPASCANIQRNPCGLSDSIFDSGGLSDSISLAFDEPFDHGSGTGLDHGSMFDDLHGSSSNDDGHSTTHDDW